MRISDSTKVYTAKEAKYLINFAMASIDRIEPDLAETIEKLGTKDSFNEKSAPFAGKTLKYLQERSYLTSLSPWEEERGNKREIEKRQAKAKIGSKRPALLLDGEIGSSWCSPRKRGAPSPHNVPRKVGPGGDLGSLEKTLSRLSEEKVDEIDIWLEFRRWKRNWEDIYSTVKTKGFSVRRVWTVTDFEGGKEAKRWAESNLLSQDITLALKTANSNWGDYFLISSQREIREENLFSQKLQSLFKSNSAYFVCPFIYDTFFVSENKMDYCPVFLGEQLAVEDRSSTQGKRTKPFHNDPLACGCTKLPNDSEFKSICDSTCSKCAETFGEQRTAREGQFEMALNGEIEQIYFPTQVSQGQPLLF